MVELESTVFPTVGDVRLWARLSPERRRALIARELDEAEKSGVAKSATMDELIARVRAKKG